MFLLYQNVMNKTLTALALSLLVTGSANAQTSEDKISIKPSGRILMDMGFFDADHRNDEMNDGCAIPDMRVRASHTKVTDRTGYEDNKVSMLETRLQIKF